MSPFHGLSAFPVTPLDGNALALDRFQRLVDRCRIPGVTSIGALGSTGLYPYLSTDFRAAAFAAAVEAAGDLPVLAGVGALTTEAVLANTRAAEAAGAAGLLLAPVSYLPLRDQEVMDLFADVAAATDLPILVYNNPGTTHFDIHEGLLAQLATIPGVEGVKNPSAVEGGVAAQVARLRVTTGSEFSLGYSGDVTITGALSSGAQAWYSVLAGTFPAISADMWAARDDGAALARFDARLDPLWDLFRAHGGIRVVYDAVEVLGLGPAVPPRPLQHLGADIRDHIAAAIDQIGLV